MSDRPRRPAQPGPSRGPRPPALLPPRDSPAMPGSEGPLRPGSVRRTSPLRSYPTSTRPGWPQRPPYFVGRGRGDRGLLADPPRPDPGDPTGPRSSFLGSRGWRPPERRSESSPPRSRLGRRSRGISPRRMKIREPLPAEAPRAILGGRGDREAARSLRSARPVAPTGSPLNLGGARRSSTAPQLLMGPSRRGPRAGDCRSNVRLSPGPSPPSPCPG